MCSALDGFAPDATTTLIPRNVPPAEMLVSGDYVLMPQNAWPWAPLGLASSRERARRVLLRAASEASIRRARHTVRIGASIPTRDRSDAAVLSNVLDVEFEEALTNPPPVSSLPAEIDGEFALCIGDLVAYRRTDLLAARWEEVYARHGVPLVIIGAARSSRVAEATRLAASRSRGVVLRCHPLARTEAIDLIRSAYVSVYPSIVEASPILLLEALACGARVIATRITGHEELVDGIPGVRVVDAHDLSGLDDALASLRVTSDLLADSGSLHRTIAGRAQLRDSWGRSLRKRLEAVVS